MQREYVAAYPDLYRRHWWWRAREEFVVHRMRECLPQPAEHRILDVGCGGGFLFERLREFGQVHGVEPDTAMKSHVPEIDSRIHWGPLETLGSELPYTAILMLDVLEHLADPASMLKNAIRVMAPGGVLIATVPAFEVLWTQHDDVNQHVTRYTRERFRNLAESVGLTPLLLKYFFHWTAPAKLMLRAWEACRSSGKERPSLPSIPAAPLNRFLYLLSRLEADVGLWRCCPFGSSLFFVGTRRHTSDRVYSVRP